MSKTTYPKKLTPFEIEKYSMFETIKNIDIAVQFSTIFKGKLYTQVERNNRLFYVKGLQLKGKTGMYAIVK